MTSLNRSTDPVHGIRQELADVRRLAEEANRRPFRIPVLAEDPPEEDPTSVWMFPDGRLRARHLNEAGDTLVIREWAPVGTPGPPTSGSAVAPEAPAPI